MTTQTAGLIPSQLYNCESAKAPSPVKKNLNAEAKEFSPEGPLKSNSNEDSTKKKNRPRSTRRKKKTGKGVKGGPEYQENLDSSNSKNTKESNKIGEGKQPSTVRTPRRRNRTRKQKNTKNEVKDNTSDTNASSITNEKTEKKQENNDRTTKPKKRNRRRTPKKKKFPWRAHIPDGAVDPISLDPLNSLPYPPFALVIEPPYTPIESFPLPKTTESKPSAALKVNNLHLFDGRVLAYYLISQLQFIDPLNRRDLTRPELEMLDQYLHRHDLGKAHVVRAYDCKGVTISTAGREAQTASGQARILQEEATSILNSLFASPNSHRNNDIQSNTSSSARPDSQEPSAFRNEFERQYMEHERRQNQTMNSNQRLNQNSQEEEIVNVIETADDGYIVIDDDEFPGLRGGLLNNQNRNISRAINDPHQPIPSPRTNEISQESLFPSLQDTTEPPLRQSNAALKTKKNQDRGISRSLQLISKTVKKTDPKEVARQKKAREDMQRRAALSQMSLLTPLSNLSHSDVPLSITTPNLSLQSQPSSSINNQIERNRILAQALNVAPATARANYNSGWARPVQPKIELDEFGNELNTTDYPDSLILAAKERIGEILRLEKRWKVFLADDKASFLNLRPMLKDLRILVHEYSDFWNLHTQSFDKEPKRYINCKKLRETSAPYPLLSQAIRDFKPTAKPIEKIATNTMSDSRAPTYAPREFPTDDNRKPLPLLPRSVTANPPEGAMFDYPTTAITITNPNEKSTSTRFSSLARERTKLTLEPRTIPLELPAFKSEKEIMMERKKAGPTIQEKQRIQREKILQRNQKKKSIIAAAFASDDDYDDDVKHDDSSSEWSSEEPIYHSSDEEIN